MRDLWYDICNQLLLHRSVEQTAAIVIGSDTAVLRDRKNTRGGISSTGGGTFRTMMYLMQWNKCVKTNLFYVFVY